MSRRRGKNPSKHPPHFIEDEPKPYSRFVFRFEATIKGNRQLTPSTRFKLTRLGKQIGFENKPTYVEPVMVIEHLNEAYLNEKRFIYNNYYKYDDVNRMMLFMPAYKMSHTITYSRDNEVINQNISILVTVLDDERHFVGGIIDDFFERDLVSR